MIKRPSKVDILILGAGWVSTFLTPLLAAEDVTYAATTTTGREGTYKFKYSQDDDDEEQYAALPAATTILITFPLRGEGHIEHLTKLYTRTHEPLDTNYQFVQLGSSGIFTMEGQDLWVTRSSKVQS